ncbi:hypothetical protein CLV59_103588 [Chitinophaga dinghuensis]|uniref:Uncharacterized protein n=1 Tax=Chitinophaga dinghuensis TaxID=1539050 RepID=A0A327WBV7_9BACT|nr:hypothetical protein [Chitinophaga dinghuensis]RAJ83618.1 hypothetical protein CLV59_103588 [Chitinophaga dinghuensis]
MKRSNTIKALSLLLIFSLHLLTGFTCSAIMLTAKATHHHHAATDPCCSDEMAKQPMLDKVLDASLQIAAAPGHVSPDIQTYNHMDIQAFHPNISQRYLTNHTLGLPVRDISIEIQRFLI